MASDFRGESTKKSANFEPLIHFLFFGPGYFFSFFGPGYPSRSSILKIYKLSVTFDLRAVNFNKQTDFYRLPSLP